MRICTRELKAATSGEPYAFSKPAAMHFVRTDWPGRFVDRSPPLTAYGYSDNNLSKPEKDPKGHCSSLQIKQKRLPQKYQLVRKNGTAPGGSSCLAQQNSWIIPLETGRRPLVLAVITYGYYNEHCIGVLMASTRQMKMENRSAFKSCLICREVSPLFCRLNRPFPSWASHFSTTKRRARALCTAHDRAFR